MSARGKDNKVTCALKKLFRGSDQKKDTENGASGSDSPARRLGRRGVSPAAAPSRHAAATTTLKNTPPVDHTIRARRLLKEYKEIQKVQQNSNFSVELVNDNLYEWHVRLHRVDPDSPLAKDMLEQNVPHILLNLNFPDNFPFSPPFMRVVEPRIEKGFVMDGGAICMELLTPRGWASAYTVEALLMQFSASLVKGQGRIAKNVKSGGNKEFSRRIAEAAFKNLVKTHEKYGWVTPNLSDG